jgi:hypothetical protein
VSPFSRQVAHAVLTSGLLALEDRRTGRKVHRTLASGTGTGKSSYSWAFASGRLKTLDLEALEARWTTLVDDCRAKATPTYKDKRPQLQWLDTGSLPTHPRCLGSHQLYAGSRLVGRYPPNADRTPLLQDRGVHGVLHRRATAPHVAGELSWP